MADEEFVPLNNYLSCNIAFFGTIESFIGYFSSERYFKTEKRIIIQIPNRLVDSV